MGKPVRGSTSQSHLEIDHPGRMTASFTTDFLGELGKDNRVPFSKPGKQSEAPNRRAYILEQGRGCINLGDVFGDIHLSFLEADVGNPNRAAG